MAPENRTLGPPGWRAVGTGCATDQLQARISRDVENRPDGPLLVADDQALASAECPLPAVNNPLDEDDGARRPRRALLPGDQAVASSRSSSTCR